MELYVFCLVAVMVLTTVVLKGIFCWMHCHHTVPWESPIFRRGKKKESIPSSKAVHMEIPMEDIERTSTPVPSDERHKLRPDVHSDV